MQDYHAFTKLKQLEQGTGASTYYREFVNLFIDRSKVKHLISVLSSLEILQVLIKTALLLHYILQRMVVGSVVELDIKISSPKQWILGM